MAVDLVYSFAEAPPPVPATAPVAAAALRSTNPLGFGIVRPFRRTARGDFATAEGEELVRSDFGQLLGTELGEVPWRTTLGTRISRLRHMANTQSLGELARVQIDEAARRYERRVQLLDVVADPVHVGEENRVQLRIRYRIGGTQEWEDTAIV
jgi:phage baseplate assembly protein W